MVWKVNTIYFTDSRTPLPEDKSLQGFLLLSKNFDDFDFNDEVGDVKVERLLRLKRILDIALWLAEIDVNGNKLIVKWVYYIWIVILRTDLFHKKQVLILFWY